MNELVVVPIFFAEVAYFLTFAGAGDVIIHMTAIEGKQQ